MIGHPKLLLAIANKLRKINEEEEDQKFLQYRPRPPATNENLDSYVVDILTDPDNIAFRKWMTKMNEGRRR